MSYCTFLYSFRSRSFAVCWLPWAFQWPSVTFYGRIIMILTASNRFRNLLFPSKYCPVPIASIPNFLFPNFTISGASQEISISPCGVLCSVCIMFSELTDSANFGLWSSVLWKSVGSPNMFYYTEVAAFCNGYRYQRWRNGTKLVDVTVFIISWCIFCSTTTCSQWSPCLPQPHICPLWTDISHRELRRFKLYSSSGWLSTMFRRR